MKKTLSLLFIILSSLQVFSQQANCYIEIVSEANITVFLDGKKVGVTSKQENGLFIQDISSGNHSLKFEKARFKPQMYTISLKKGEVLTFKLKKFIPNIEIIESGNTSTKEEIFELGNIRIQSLPTSINIDISDLEINMMKKQDNLSLNNVPVGTYNVECTWKTKKLVGVIKVRKDATTHIMINLLKGSIKELSITDSPNKLSNPGVLSKPNTKTDNTNKSVSLVDLVKVDAGKFHMGNKDGKVDEIPIHKVSLDSYYIGKYEVSQGLWKKVMGNNPSYFKNDKLPVEQVSWLDVQIFIGKLNKMTGKNYRLPTEAEWEFAARGGSASNHYDFSGSNNIALVGWIDSNSNKKTQYVGLKQANELGIYDMSGNVLEWCNDWFSDYEGENQRNPKGPKDGTAKLTRGGSWFRGDFFSHVAYRTYSDPSYGKINLGFRLAHDI